MTSITRRDALMGAGGALGGAAVLLAEKDATASPVQDPLVGLWRERTRLRAKASRISEQADAIERGLPEWVRKFSGVVVEVRGRSPRNCWTVDEIDAAMRRRSLFSLDPPSKEAVDAWRAEGKAQRDALVAKLERTRRQVKGAKQRSGLTAKDAEHEAIWDDILRIEDQITDTQAVTTEGLLVQALFFADLRKNEDERDFEARLAKSMGVAARRMAPELADAGHLSGEVRL